MIQETTTLNSSPIRRVAASVEVINPITSAAATFTNKDALMSIDVDRVGETNKFFGFGVSHKATIKLLDKNREIEINKGDAAAISYSANDEAAIFPIPYLYVDDVKRDENTNQITFIAYDMLKAMGEHTIAELGIKPPYTIMDLALACTEFFTDFGIGLIIEGGADDSFNTSYENGANFDGTETLREVLDAIAEATQTIYYINGGDELVFKRLNINGDAALEIGKKDYFTLDTKGAVKLGQVISVTELGDNVSASAKESYSGTVITADTPAADIPIEIRLESDSLTDFSGVTLTRSGKNLLNITKSLKSDIMVANSDGSYTLTKTTATNRFANDIPVSIPANNIWTISAEIIATNCAVTTAALRYLILYTDGSSSTGALNASGVSTKTTTKDIKAIRFYIDNTSEAVGAYINFKNAQLEFGEASTTYEPYQEPVTYSSAADGVIEGVTTIAPTTVLYTTGVTINADIYKDIDTDGETQYIKNNPFLDLREDIATLINAALENVNGLTYNQFNLTWRGDYRVEIGDKIAYQTKDNLIYNSYLINDKLSYNGALKQVTSWEYKAEGATAANPTTIGEAIKETYAKVDKAEKQIDLLVSETSANSAELSQLQLDTQGIAATVTNIETTTSEALEGVNTDLAALSREVAAKVTAEELTVKVKEELNNGVDKVTTSTGFTFDADGLTVEKSGSEMKTQITEDGMQVFKDSEAVLTANNRGVNAVNLHATTYLIIGTNSRFENYGEDRTACFWIGG